MVKQNRTTTARQPEPQISDTASVRRASRTRPNMTDDVIVSLADAIENKRARQVTEWERAQPLYLRQSA
ncbi:MAG: hypothetical protein IT173_13545 [Acidobacteria bacterium]|nr:hypothetical protein [Acidobacteriota bacterium]